MKLIKSTGITLVFWCVLVWFNSAIAIEANIKLRKMTILQDVVLKSLPNDNVQIVLQFSDLPSVPSSFAMDSPPELIFDFMDTVNHLAKDKLLQKLSFNLVKKLSFANANNKIRMVIALNSPAPFVSEIKGNNLILTIKNEIYKSSANPHQEISDISALDFHRGNDGEGKLILDVKAEVNNIDVKEGDNNEIQIEFKNVTIANQLLKHFDVSDFGTPIKKISVTKEQDKVIVKIIAKGDYDKVSYRIGDKYIVEARPVTELQQKSDKSRKFKFTGDKISLNFQEIEIRAVLQLLADFTGLNIVANDSVQGNVTLRLDDIPWDQALDFILKSKGLSKRESGNILLIAPASELSKYEETELESTKQLESLEPLRTEFVPINYAKAAEIVTMLKGDKNSSLLSDRGSINVDSRTNTLLIKDVGSKIEDMKDLIKVLDVPVKQVLIEAYIVQCNQNFQDQLGIKMNGAAKASIGGRKIGFGSDSGKVGSLGTKSKTTIDPNGTKTIDTEVPEVASASTPAFVAQNIADGKAIENIGRFFDLSTGGTAVLGLAVNRLPGGTILNLEIDAAEKEGMTTTISKPRILTLDNKAATIESGANVPYTTPGSTGYAGTTSFQKVTLNLTVTPQITPNDQISLDLSISNDSIDATGASGGSSTTPGVKTTSLRTNVLVDNGETIVLGGVLTDNLVDAKTKIPYLSSLPLIGKLFQNKNIQSAQSEMLVFITPRILKNFDKNARR